MNETRRGYRAIGMGVAATLVASFGLVSPAAAQEEPPTSASGIVASLVDEVALTQAVEGFTAGDEASVAELAAVVAPEQGVDVEAASHVSLADGELVLASEEVIGEGGDGLEIGINYAGASLAPEIVDGVAVSTQVEPGLDIVARATDDGAQVLAVLADENAPTELAFDLDLPEGAELKELSDGSVNIVAPVETEVPLPGEEARFDAEIEDFILQEGITEENLSSLTEEQLDELLAIPDVETKSTVIEQVIATIESPWAVDAEGMPLDTDYVIEGNTLVQKVQTTSNTTFPVVLDPAMNWVKRLWHAGNCLGSIAALGTGAVAFVKAGVKFVKIVSTAKKVPRFTTPTRHIVH